ncbi:putative RNA recognition motif domain, nucleotide-binding alpha-beta plait domain superfamily [Helianthus annuus]|nr:putative RNA recognition motif domain, nucleotide-binding alpha-beta plait domain superfamily [Helianthus annuus]
MGRKMWQQQKDNWNVMLNRHDYRREKALNNREREEGEIFNEGEYKSDNRYGYNKHTRPSNEEEEAMKTEQATTFYVSNIHPKLTDGELWTECRSYGHLVDAYIAKKLDKRGLRFGFLRFAKVKDETKMVKALNQLCFEGWKIRANVAKFVKIKKNPVQMMRKEWVRKTCDNTPQPKQMPTYHGSKVSWADIARGKRPEKQEDIALKFGHESEVYQKWKEVAIIGELKSINHLRKLWMMKEDLSLQDAEVRYVGGMKVLITAKNEESARVIFNRDEKSWDQWLGNIQQWNGDVIPFQRMAWLVIRGVPIQIWGDDVFNCIAERYGKIVEPSEADDRDLNLNYDVVGVIVNDGALINEKIKIWWKGMMLDVWVSEANYMWQPKLVPDRTNDKHRVPEELPPENEVPSPEIGTPMNLENEGIPKVGVETLNEGNVEARETGEQTPMNEEREKTTNEEENEVGNNDSPRNVEKAQNNTGASEQETGRAQDIPNNNQNGPNEERHSGPTRMKHFKRKRTSLAKSCLGSLKPNQTILKRKIPDLNIELSDESRLRTKRRAVIKRRNKRRNKEAIGRRNQEGRKTRKK